MLLVAVLLSGCGDDDPLRPTENGLPADTAHGAGMLLSWGELTGRIVFATPSRIVLVDAIRREVRTVRNVLPNEVVVELDVAAARGEIAVGALVDNGPPQITVTKLADGSITRLIPHSSCPQFLSDGRLTWVAGDSVLIEGSFVARGAAAMPSCPAWSPDGSFFVEVAEQQVRKVMVVNGARSILVGETFRTGWLDPDVSPDGRKVALVKAEFPGSRLGIFEVNTDGTGMREISADPRFIDLSYSPDAAQLATVFHASPRPGVYLVDIVAGSLHQLTTEGTYAVAWSP